MERQAQVGQVDEEQDESQPQATASDPRLPSDPFPDHDREDEQREVVEGEREAHLAGAFRDAQHGQGAVHDRRGHDPLNGIGREAPLRDRARQVLGDGGVDLAVEAEAIVLRHDGSPADLNEAEGEQDDDRGGQEAVTRRLPKRRRLDEQVHG